MTQKFIAVDQFFMFESVALLDVLSDFLVQDFRNLLAQTRVIKLHEPYVYFFKHVLYDVSRVSAVIIQDFTEGGQDDSEQ